MIICPICKTENSHLDFICKNCSSFLQSKIENINLFEILWSLLENPTRGFKNIALARHKNFIFFITTLFGISLTYLFFEIINLYDHFNKPLLIMIIPIVLGPFTGLINLMIVSLILFLSRKIFKLVKVSFKNIYTVCTFSTIPFIYLLVFIFPVKLLTYGINLFSSNPSPLIINSTVYWIIQIISVLLIAYFIKLFITGIIVLFDIRLSKALLVSLIPLSIIFGIYFTFSKYSLILVKNL